MVLGLAWMTSTAVQARPQVAVLELHNGTGERLARFNSASEDLLRDRVVAIDCCTVLSRELTSSRLLKQPIRLHEIYGNPTRAAALGLALQVDFLMTGRALDYEQDGELHRLHIELVVVDVNRQAYVYQQRLTAQLSSSETRLQHRSLLHQLFTDAASELALSIQGSFQLADGLSASSGSARPDPPPPRVASETPPTSAAIPDPAIMETPDATPRHRESTIDSSTFGLPQGPGSAALMAAWRAQVLGPQLESLGEEDRRRVLEAMGLDASESGLEAPDAPTVTAPSASHDPLHEAWRLIEQARMASARPLLQRALRDAIRSGDRRNEASARDGLCEIAKLQKAPQMLAPALAHGLLALDLHRQLADNAAQSLALRRLATIYSAIGQGAKAVEYLEEAEALGEVGADPPVAAGEILEGFGRARIALGDLDSGRRDLLRALEHWRINDRKVRQARVLTQLAQLDASLGRVPEADAHLIAVMGLYDPAPIKFDLDGLLQAIRETPFRGNVMTLAMPQMIAAQAAAASATQDERTPPSWDTAYDSIITRAYQEILEDIPMAADGFLRHRHRFANQVASQIQPAGFDQVLEPLHGIPDEVVCTIFQRSQVLSQRAHLYEQIGRSREAEGLRQEAWDAWEATSGRLDMTIFNKLAPGQREQLPLLMLPDIPAQEARDAGAFPPPAATEARCGHVSFYRLQLWQASTRALAGRLETAHSTYLGLQLADPHTHTEALIGLAQVLENQGETDQALHHYQEAIAWGDMLLDGLRLEPSSYAARLTMAYESAIRLLVDRGDVDTAFTVAEQGRAYALHRQLASNPPIRGGTSTEDLRSLKAVRLKIARLREQQRLEDFFRASHGRTPQAASSSEQRLKNLQQEKDLLERRLDAEQSDVASLLAPRALDLSTVQTNIIPTDAKLLVYFVLPQETLAWVIDRKNVHLRRLAIGRQQIQDDVALMLDGVTLQQPFEAPSGRLYEALVRPLAPWLQKDHILVIPHGALHYLPFAALWNAQEKRFWIAEAVLSTAPSVTALGHFGRHQSSFTGSALVLGNPDRSLDFAQQEAEAVAALLGTAAHTQEEASKPRFLQRAGQVDVVHVAAHGVFNAANPLASRLELAPPGDAGHLTAADILTLQLPETDLVVLSACQTGLGELSRGDDIVGLSRAFLATGAPSVITTLWSVEDAATSDLMTSFYRHLKNPDMDLAEALRASQLEISQTPDRSAPYFWAGFLLSGDPKGWK